MNYGCGCVNCIKPPIGLSSRRLWLEDRFKEVSDAINRYKDAGMIVPTEWYEEFFQLTEVLEK